MMRPVCFPGDQEPERLAGGYVTEVVRIGDTVRRHPGAHAEYVHRLLARLEQADYGATPKLLGIDEQGREILTFIRGHVPVGNVDEPAVRDHRSLEAVARLVRRMHDLTAGTTLAGDDEVACHNDLSPKNTVYDVSSGWWRPVALIDWDLAGPGRRIHDLAHMCWQYPNLGPRWDDPAEAGVLVRILCDAYGAQDRSEVLPTILWWQDRCWRGIEQLAAEGDPAMRRLRDAGGALRVREAADWTETNMAKLREALR
ncbi:MAG TPA: phosphotransferase [Streptosporangiaceae bacterium]|nr:phosphotransferase [Streptosporangiaceae bacterium]